MGSAIDAWIEYDDDALYYPERAAEPPFSHPPDFCIPLTDFNDFYHAKDYRFFAAISGIRSQPGDPAPLFSMRGGLPKNVSDQTRRDVSEIIGEDNPSLSWLSYSEIEQAPAHKGLQRESLPFTTNIVLDLMQSIEKWLGAGRSGLIFHID